MAELRSKMVTVPAASSMKRRAAQLGGGTLPKQRKTVHFQQ
jgi:hypothetical protein